MEDRTLATFIGFTVEDSRLLAGLGIRGDFKADPDPEKFRVASCGSWIDRRFKWAAFLSVGMKAEERHEWLT